MYKAKLSSHHSLLMDNAYNKHGSKRITAIAMSKQLHVSLATTSRTRLNYTQITAACGN